MEISATVAGAVASHTGTTVFRTVASMMAEINQGVEAGISYQVGATAVTTVTTVRPALLDILLPAETDTTTAAVAGIDVNNCFINKFHDFLACLHSL